MYLSLQLEKASLCLALLWWKTMDVSRWRPEWHSSEFTGSSILSDTLPSPNYTNALITSLKKTNCPLRVHPYIWGYRFLFFFTRVSEHSHAAVWFATGLKCLSVVFSGSLLQLCGECGTFYLFFFYSLYQLGCDWFWIRPLIEGAVYVSTRHWLSDLCKNTVRTRQLRSLLML